MAISSFQTLQQSFNIIGYSLLFLGIYSFRVRPSKRAKLYRILQMVYCSIVTIVHSIVIFGLTYTNFLHFMRFLRYHNVNMIAYYISSVITLKACLVQRALYYWKARDIHEYINDWKSYEIEYKSLTGKQLKAVSFKKTLTITILSSLAIIYVAIMNLLGERNSNGPPLSVTLVFLTDTTVFYSVIGLYLMRLYTELMWYMFSNALRNAALQLADDYKNDLCQERGLDRTNYEYLWTKLAKLQSRLPLIFSKIYGYQLAINFLQLLFHAFVFFEFIFRYMTIEILVRVLKDPDERAQFIYLMLGLYGQTTTCFVYLWLGSVTAGAAQKALIDNTKKTLLGILSDEAHSSTALHEQTRGFLQKVTATNTQITFSGYGRIDRSFFCTILITWINYMIILLQFKISFYEEDKDETIEGTSRNKRSISNVEFENYDSFLGLENMKFNLSSSLPFLLDWHTSFANNLQPK